MVLGSKVINESDKMTKVMTLTIRKCTRKKVWEEWLKEKLEKEKAFAGVVYEIDSWSAEKFFNKREDLVKEKEPEAEEKPEAAAGNESPPESVTIPGIPGALIPGVEAVKPESEETSESTESVEKQDDSE